MSRSIQAFPNFGNADKVFETMRAWREKCFFADGSMFRKQMLWTADNIAKLQDALNDRTQSELPFMEELKHQLKSIEPEEIQPEVIQLAAEAFWICLLFPKMDAPNKKIERIKTIWEWSGLSFPNSAYASDQILSGVAYQSSHKFNSVKIPAEFESQLLRDLPLSGDAKIPRRLRLLHYLLETAQKIKKLPNDEQRRLNENAWAFVAWLDQEVRKPGHANQRRNATLYLLFPDHFERCFKTYHKRQIVDAFRNRLPENAQPRDEEPLTLDRTLYRIRQSLEEEYKDESLDFYRTPLLEQWFDQSPKESEAIKPTPSHPLNAILYGPPGTGKTYATAARCVEICDGEVPNSNEEIRARYAELIEEGQVEFITFHQSYSYEEFVEGLRPQTDPEGGAGFRLVPTDGVLKRIAEHAQQSINPVPHVLVIDEINRANVSKVLGELVTLLEEDKRQGAENEISVTLPHSGEHFSLPANLYILGTMNTADRSIALLDTALRRRFDFEELPPKPKLLKEAAESSGIDLPKVLRTMNERLEYLLDRDHLIGHAWLMNAKTREDIDQAMRHKIIPLIAEYFYDDWSKVCAILGGIPNGFVERRNLDTPPNLDHAAGEERYRWKCLDEFTENAYELLLGKISGAADSE